MPKPERLVAGEDRAIGADQLAPQQRAELVVDRFAQCAAAQLEHGAAMKHRALDRGPFAHDSLWRVELIQPRRKERLDGRWHRHLQAVGGGLPLAVVAAQGAFVDQHRDELLSEQRVPVGRLRSRATWENAAHPYTAVLKGTPDC